MQSGEFGRKRSPSPSQYLWTFEKTRFLHTVVMGGAAYFVPVALVSSLWGEVPGLVGFCIVTLFSILVIFAMPLISFETLVSYLKTEKLGSNGEWGSIEGCVSR